MKLTFKYVGVLCSIAILCTAEGRRSPKKEPVAVVNNVSNLNETVAEIKTEEMTIWQVLGARKEKGRFVGAISSAQVVRILDDTSQDYTLLVPNNAAMALKAREAEPLYHILQGTIEHFIPHEELYTMQSGAELPEDSTQVVAVTKDGHLSDGTHVIKVTNKDSPIRCKNGLIYIIDNILQVPTAKITHVLHPTPLEHLLGWARKGAKGRGVTLFLPSLSSYRKAKSYGITDKEIAMRHLVIGDPVYRSELREGFEIPTRDGTLLRITLEDGQISVNGVPIKQANVITSYGVIHLLDGGIDPLPEDPKYDPIKVQQFYAKLDAESIAGTGTTAVPVAPTERSAGIPLHPVSVEGGNRMGKMGFKNVAANDRFCVLWSLLLFPFILIL